MSAAAAEAGAGPARCRWPSAAKQLYIGSALQRRQPSPAARSVTVRSGRTNGSGAPSLGSAPGLTVTAQRPTPVAPAPPVATEAPAFSSDLDAALLCRHTDSLSAEGAVAVGSRSPWSVVSEAGRRGSADAAELAVLRRLLALQLSSAEERVCRPAAVEVPDPTPRPRDRVTQSGEPRRGSTGPAAGSGTGGGPVRPWPLRRLVGPLISHRRSPRQKRRQTTAVLVGRRIAATTSGSRTDRTGCWARQESLCDLSLRYTSERTHGAAGPAPDRPPSDGSQTARAGRSDRASPGSTEPREESSVQDRPPPPPCRGRAAAVQYWALRSGVISRRTDLHVFLPRLCGADGHRHGSTALRSTTPRRVNGEGRDGAT